MLDVAVVGCGTAGGAAALFLSRAGHRVTVHERVADPRPVGAGIVLQPTGQAVLARLGLEAEVLSRGARLDGLVCRTDGGRTLVELDYRLLGDVFGLGTHRGVLFDALFRAARREAEVHCGVGIDALVRERTRVSLPGLAARTVERVRLIDDGGRRHGPYDLVVVADGARSRLRDDVPIPMRVRPYPWGALWFLADDPERRFRDRLFQVARGNGRFLGFLPTGLAPDDGPPVTSLFYSVRADAVDRVRREGLEAWKHEVRVMLESEGSGRVEDAEPLLAQIESVDQLLFTGYHDVEMFPWAHERVVFLGDAAHAMSPQLGQGCNLALLDALVLAECLHAFADPDRALDAYSQRRKRHLRVYTQATRWLTPFFQGDVELFGELRDFAMPLLARLPFANALMVKSMAGVLGSWLGSTLALPERTSEVPGRLSRAPSPA